MQWEVLPARMSKRSNEPAISVQKNYRVSWNRGTQTVLEDAEYVELLLDRPGKRLGIRKSIKAETSYTVRKAGAQDTWGISAEGSLKAVGITVEASHRRYAAVDDGIVHIDIAELWPD